MQNIQTIISPPNLALSFLLFRKQNDIVFNVILGNFYDKICWEVSVRKIDKFFKRVKSMFQYYCIMVDFIENSTKFQLNMRIKMFASGILTNMHTSQRNCQ